MRGGPSSWGGGNLPGALYVIQEEDRSCVGNCWMKGRLLVGDLVLCLEHSGDGFYYYILVENGPGWPGIEWFRGVPESKFGSYTFGTRYLGNPLSEREFHLLAAGERIERETV